MPNLKEQISADIKEAMRAKDSARLTVLRGINSNLNNKEIEKRAKGGATATLTDEEMLASLLTEAKRRKESADVFTKGGRPDLAEQELKELQIIQAYLPAQLSKEDVEACIEKAIAAAPVKEFGPVMKDVMKELRGKADSSLITEIIKAKLG